MLFQSLIDNCFKRRNYMASSRWNNVPNIDYVWKLLMQQLSFLAWLDILVLSLDSIESVNSKFSQFTQFTNNPRWDLGWTIRFGSFANVQSILWSFLQFYGWFFETISSRKTWMSFKKNHRAWILGQCSKY